MGLALAAAVIGIIAGYDPTIAIAAALGLAFVLLVMVSLTAGLYLFTVATFLDSVALGGAGLTFAKVLGLLLALSWLAHAAVRGRSANDFLTDHPAFSFVLFGFLGWVLLSAVWATDPMVSITSLYRYALNAALFLIIYTAVRNREEATWVVAAFLLGAVISASYGILSPAPADGAELDRLGGAGVNPNELAALLVAALSLAAAFAAGWRRTPLVPFLALVVIAFCVGGVVLSFSRGGLVALAVALMAAVALGGRWRPIMLGLAGVVVAVLIGFFAFVATPAEQDRITAADGGAGRTDIWAVGWRMVQANPIGGVGAGNFPISSVHFLLAPGATNEDQYIVDDPQVAHNMYLELWAEEGAVGLALFLSILGFGVVSALRAARGFRDEGDQRMELLSRSVAVALISLLAADFFGSFQFTKQLWVLLALGPVLLRISRAPAELDETSDTTSVQSYGQPLRLQPS